MISMAWRRQTQTQQLKPQTSYAYIDPFDYIQIDLYTPETTNQHKYSFNTTNTKLEAQTNKYTQR